jgi:exonuclease III
VVVTDHGHFVLINVYVPNAGGKPDRPRLATKLDFLRLLKAKADGFLEQGREVGTQTLRMPRKGFVFRVHCC